MAHEERNEERSPGSLDPGKGPLNPGSEDPGLRSAEDPGLHSAVDQALRRLPTVRAPHTLMTRVMAATVERAPRPWYTRTWLAWPREWQAVSIFAMLALGAAWMLISPAADPALAGAATVAGAAADRAGVLLQTAEVISAFARVLWRSVVFPVAAVGFVVAVLAALASGVCWTTLHRLAFDPAEGTSR